jgi:hypothetical protein
MAQLYTAARLPLQNSVIPLYTNSGLIGFSFGVVASESNGCQFSGGHVGLFLCSVQFNADDNEIVRDANHDSTL